MLHHPGEILSIFRPGDRDVRSADSDTLATVKMWDENVLTLVVDGKIATDLHEGDKVLVDYRPHNISTAEKPALTQKQLVTKIIRGERAEIVWKEYKRFYSAQRQKATQQQVVSDYMG